MKKYVVFLLTGFIVFELITSLLIIRSITHPIKYENYIKQYAKIEDLSPILIASIINVESSFKSDAKSHAGACGLMQILPSTADYICTLNDYEDVEHEQLLNPEINIKIGCMYVRYLSNKFNSLDLVLASYNAGETVVRSWLKNTEYSYDGKTLHTIPYKETKNYIKKVKNNIKIYKNYSSLKTN